MTDILGIPVYQDDFVMFAYPSYVNEAELLPAIVTDSDDTGVNVLFLSAASKPVIKRLKKEMFVRVSRFDIPKVIRDRLLDDSDVL